MGGPPVSRLTRLAGPPEGGSQLIHSRSLAERISRGDLDEGLQGPLHARVRLRRLLRRGGLALNVAAREETPTHPPRSSCASEKPGILPARFGAGEETPTHPPPLGAGEETIEEDVPPRSAPAPDPHEGP